MAGRSLQLLPFGAYATPGYLDCPCPPDGPYVWVGALLEKLAFSESSKKQVEGFKMWILGNWKQNIAGYTSRKPTDSDEISGLLP